MSASTALMRRPKYQDQLKLARAEIAVSWALAVIDQVIAALKIEPAVFKSERDAVARQRWFGSYY